MSATVRLARGRPDRFNQGENVPGPNAFPPASPDVLESNDGSVVVVEVVGGNVVTVTTGSTAIDASSAAHAARMSRIARAKPEGERFLRTGIKDLML